MNVTPGSLKLVASKSETRRLTEARIICELAKAARLVGDKHLDDRGYIIPTAAEARVNADYEPPVQ